MSTSRIAQTEPDAGLTRAERAGATIRTAALTIFFRDGYQGASVDEIAALAAVSKQTIYKRFTDKRGLFLGSILGAIETTYDRFAPSLERLESAPNLEPALRDYARVLLTEVMQPEVLRIRRLVIAEANRFPDLGATYYERTYERTTARMVSVFASFAERGLLDLNDPHEAVQHFTWLVFGVPRNRVMLLGDGEQMPTRELRRHADSGTRAFLRAYTAW